jgi:SAM-dependent methyltransferase
MPGGPPVAGEAQLGLLDRILRGWRFMKARRFIQPGAAVLDVGCLDGALFDYLGERLGFGVGIDPVAPPGAGGARYRLIRGKIPESLPVGETFDVITMLAVLEHLPESLVEDLARRSVDLLRSGGRVVITVPSPSVDRLLHLFIRLRLMRGTAVHEHHGFEPSSVPAIFAKAGFHPVVRKSFELGFNNLFVFAKEARARR